jgi:hypothetical protein
VLENLIYVVKCRNFDLILWYANFLASLHWYEETYFAAPYIPQLNFHRTPTKTEVLHTTISGRTYKQHCLVAPTHNHFWPYLQTLSGRAYIQPFLVVPTNNIVWLYLHTAMSDFIYYRLTQLQITCKAEEAKKGWW